MRKNVSLKIGVVSEYIRRSGINTIVNNPQYGTVDIFANIFNLEISSPEIVKDSCYKAIGNYQFLNIQWWRKIINPIYWAVFVIRMPFMIAQKCGINIVRIESSKLARLYKLISSFVVFLVSITGLLKYFGITSSILLSILRSN